MLHYHAVRHWRFPDIPFAYDERGTILYALGIGLSGDPTDRGQLRFLYEHGLQAVPTMATIMGHPGLWWRDPATGADWTRVLQGDQDLELVGTLPPAGTMIGRNRVVGVHDQGEGRHALVQVERDIRDAATGALIARGRRISVLRGHGGFSTGGTPSDPAPDALPPIEDIRRPDLEVTLASLPQAALIYRLCGDRHPLHADPATAQAAGFARPILHGLASFGMAAHAALRILTGYDPARLKRIAARFAAPVYPGETLQFRFWRGDDGLSWRFRARIAERDAVALDRGLVELHPSGQAACGISA